MTIRLARFRWLLFCIVICWVNNRLSAQNWSAHTILNDRQEAGEYTDAVTDAAGNLHISSWNKAKDRLVYGFRAAGMQQWALETVDDAHSGGFRSAIALDKDNIPCIAYFENANGVAQVRYAKKTNGAWQIQTVTRDNYGAYGPDVEVAAQRVQPSIDLIIGAFNEPTIVFYDGKTAPCSATFREYETELLDDFDRADNARLGQTAYHNKVWRESATGGTENIHVTNNQLVIAPSTVTGAAYTAAPLDYVFDQFTTLSNTTDIVEWGFNLRSTFTQHQGFAGGSNGAAVMLSATSPDYINQGSGFALVLGDAGAGDSLRIVYYDNGLQGTLTTILGVSGVTNQYLSVKILYTGYSDIETNKWSLYLSKNDNFFDNPLTLTELTASAQMVVGIGSGLTRYTGFAWAYAGVSGDSMVVDNFYTSAIPYGYRMKQAYQDLNTGDWLINDFGHLPVWDLGNQFAIQCEGKQGVRYGEYCNIVKDNLGVFSVVAAGKVNSELKVFKQVTDSVTWNNRNLDSLGAFVSGTELTDYRRSHITFEGISSLMSETNRIHSAYTISDDYGREIINDFSTYPFVVRYARLSPNGDIINKTIFPVSAADKDFHYRAHTSLAIRGDDTLFVSFSDLESNKYVLAVSYTGGNSWDLTALATVTRPNQAAKLLIANNKLHCWYYDTDRAALVHGERDLFPFDAAWQFETLTRSSLSGVSLNSIVENDQITVAYNDIIQQSVKLAEQNGGGTFDFDSIPALPGKYSFVRLAKTASGKIHVFYADELRQKTRMAVRNGTTWTQSSLDDSFAALYIDAKAVGDVVHVVYFDPTANKLVYKKIENGSATLTESVDGGGGAFAGEYASLFADASNNLHVSYYERKGNALRYAFRSNSSNLWNTVEVASGENDTSQVFCQWTSISAGANNVPQIAFRHPAENLILYARPNANNVWQIDTAISNPTATLGIPLSLQIDPSGNPWIAVAQSADNHLIQIVRKKYKDKLWTAFPVFNNTNELSLSFDYFIRNDKMFLVGRHTKGGAEGLGYLSSQGWDSIPTVVVEPQTGGLLAELKAYPNPFTDETVFNFQLTQNAQIRLEVFDLQGRLLETLIDRPCFNGLNTCVFDGKLLPAGLYLCKLTANGETLVWKMAKR